MPQGAVRLTEVAYTPSVLFRSMSPDTDGLPRLGRSRRNLGVVVPGDIEPDASGEVAGGRGGLSVSPCSMSKLPPHRQPRGMRPSSTGRRGDCVYSLDLEALTGSLLSVRPDPENPWIHALIEPSKTMTLHDYESALSGTRSEWKRAWP